MAVIQGNQETLENVTSVCPLRCRHVLGDERMMIIQRSSLNDHYAFLHYTYAVDVCLLVEHDEWIHMTPFSMLPWPAARAADIMNGLRHMIFVWSCFVRLIVSFGAQRGSRAAIWLLNRACSEAVSGEPATTSNTPIKKNVGDVLRCGDCRWPSIGAFEIRF
jgi:hypothetical protein